MRTRMVISGLTLFLMAFLTSACSLIDAIREPTTVTATPDAAVFATLEPPNAEVEGLEGETEITPTPAPPQDIVVWAVSDVVGIELLESQIEEFTSTQSSPETTVVLEPKAANGPGGIQRYLEAAPAVAPSILPDLVLIPFSQLPQFVDAGLVFPLTPYIGAEEFNDLYPAGRTISRVGEQFFGYPYTFTNFNHLVVNRVTVTQTLTTEWNEFAALPNQFVFAGAGSDGADLLLMLYMAEGGTLRDETGRIRLEEEPLRSALTRIATAAENGLIVSNSNQITTQNSSWDIFRNGTADIIMTDSQLYRNQIDQISGADFAPLPGPQEAIPARTKGFVWAITTADPQRQLLAAELLNFLISPANMGIFSVQTLSLPTRRSAFDSWSPDPYSTFLQDQLERAAVYPTAALGPISDSLSTAMRSLLSSSNPQSVVADIAQNTVASVP